MKTAKMMQDFNWLCNLDVNHNLLLVYLCTLHNKIISPAHFVVYVLWRPTPTWFCTEYKCLNLEFFPRMNADFLIVMVRYSVSTFSTPVGKQVRLAHRCKALTSCLHPVAICDDISVTLGGQLFPTHKYKSIGQVSHL